MKIKVAEAEGPVLDWLAAKANNKSNILAAWFIGSDYTLRCSTNWTQGGPIIGRLELNFLTDPYAEPNQKYTAIHRNTGTTAHGPTHLVAAMRCYVTKELGAKVEVPDELL